MPTFEYASDFPFSVETLFAWHKNPSAFDRLAPPWQDIRVLDRSGGIEDGGRLIMELRLGPIKQRWVAEHRDYIENRQFCDVQVEGPFAAWTHFHRLDDLGENRSRLRDQIEFSPPLGPVGSLGEGVIRSMLTRLFRFRHARTEHDIVRHIAFADRARMRIAVSGASGLIGGALSTFMQGGGHTIYLLTRARDDANPNAIHWDPVRGLIDAAALENMDAVIHLAGENIASERWTTNVKDRIRRSRVDGTGLLARTLARLNQPPQVFISASAIGYYGHRDEPVDEDSPAGKGFLAEVCQQWEAAAEPAREAGIRVVHPRIGMVLARQGGALAKMLTPFSLGMGGPVGSGEQGMSWIALDDLVGLIHFLLYQEAIEGPVIAAATTPVSNREFGQTLGRVLKRPAIAPLPTLAVETLFGEMGRELLLSGQRAISRKLPTSGFEFLHSTLESALSAELGV